MDYLQKRVGIHYSGEEADIIKKDGDKKIVNDEKVRNNFIEELCDVFMYLNDVILCYSI